MSVSYGAVALSMAYNAGHTDAWEKRLPVAAPQGVISDQWRSDV